MPIFFIAFTTCASWLFFYNLITILEEISSPQQLLEMGEQVIFREG